MARSGLAGTTHLIEADALAVIEAAGSDPSGMSLREIAHTLGVDADAEPLVAAGLGRIIDGLIQFGLLCRVDDETNAGPQST